jgi:GT2 family glycosyltransferase
MTLAPPSDVTNDAAVDPPAAATVTALLLLRGTCAGLDETLDSLALQTRSPERLLVVDVGTDGNAVEQVRSHRGIAAAIPFVRYLSVPAQSTTGEAIRLALADEAAAPDTTRDDEPVLEHLWVLTPDSAASPMTLARLLDALRRSPSAGVAGPKLVDWERPGLLQSVGYQLTRTGRLIPSPQPGEPDQGQYDRRTDVLAVPATGILVERELLERLHGHEPAFGEFGGDLDFAWRAQQAGRRVIVVPRATLRTAAPAAEGEDESAAAAARKDAARIRRQARRVALTRCGPWAVPFLAAWIVLTSLASGLVLLLAKQPRAAWAELADIGAVLTPARTLGARWRSRGTRALRRRDLAGLFVTRRTALRHTADLIHDQVALEPRRHDDAGSEVVETGPVADEAQDLNVMTASWAARAVRNPGVLATLAALVVSTVGGRNVGGGLGARLDHGLAGGELVGLRATSGTLWHSWLDGWHGAGLGHADPQGPYLAVLAGLAWVGEHLPVLDPAASPTGAAVAFLFGAALPLATLTAYLGARVITHARWTRALAALAWSMTAVLATGLAGGRLGAVVAAVLLPLVAAGFGLAARRSTSATATAATMLAAAVVAAFVPAILALTVVVGLLLVLVGRGGGARLRGLALAVGPVALLGPWAATLVERPHLLLTGPGLSVWGGTPARPWELALLHPGGSGSFPVLLSAPLVAAGVIGLLRGGSRSAGASVLALMGLVGLAVALAAPRVTLGTIPEGMSGAGEPITAWPGTGLYVYALALIGAALLGADQLPVRRSTGGWPAVLRWPVAAAVIAAVVGSGAWTAWHSFGSSLSAWSDPRPAVAVDQAENTLANRMLLLDSDDGEIAYQLVGREAGPVARDLPATRPAHEGLATAVGALFAQGAAPGELAPARDLAAQAIGFVGLRAEPTDPRIRALDATAGLSRLGEHNGIVFWRVLPGGGAAEAAGQTESGARGSEPSAALAPSRARIATEAGEAAVPVRGDHGRLATDVVVPAGARLVLAEPADWVRHARVTIDGDVLAPDTAAAQPSYALPAGPGRLAVEVLPQHQLWLWAQGALLGLVVFLAVPFGNRGGRRRT